MNISYMPISKLKLNDKNPRKIDKDQFDKLCRNIETDPEYFKMRPCLVNETAEGNIVYAGNQRLRAAKKLGLKQVPCIIAKDVPEDLLKKRIVLDNITHGEHDFEMLSSLYDPAELLELGMKEHELHLDAAELIEGGSEEESEILEPGKDEDALTKLGDIYELNQHRIVCGDSTDFDVIKNTLNGNNPEIIYADPPYGIKLLKDSGNLGKSKKYNKILGDENSSIARDIYNMAVSLNIPVMIFWGANHYSSFLPDSPCWIVWDKQGGKSVTFADCELAWTNMKKPVRLFQHIWDGFRRDSEKGEERTHPTQKPVELAKNIIKLVGIEGSILDPSLGSGSTLIAAEQLGRICYGIELSPAYCDIIVNRWKNYMVKNGREYSIKRNGEVQ